jgi:hypothetical protein
LRDATRRGLWLYPFGSIPPIPYAVYIVSCMLLPHSVPWLACRTRVVRQPAPMHTVVVLWGWLIQCNKWFCSADMVHNILLSHRWEALLIKVMYIPKYVNEIIRCPISLEPQAILEFRCSCHKICLPYQPFMQTWRNVFVELIVVSWHAVTINSWRCLTLHTLTGIGNWGLFWMMFGEHFCNVSASAQPNYFHTFIFTHCHHWQLGQTEDLYNILCFVILKAEMAQSCSIANSIV